MVPLLNKTSIYCIHGSDAQASRKNAEYLQNMGLPSIEVWHIQSNTEELENLVARDLPIIVIGGSVRVGESIREAVFKKVFSPFQNKPFTSSVDPSVYSLPLLGFQQMVQAGWQEESKVNYAPEGIT